MRYLVTGGAGFIGSHLADALLSRDAEVICVDNFNDYYNPSRKRANIATALQHPVYTLVEGDFRDAAAMEHIFETYRPNRVAHIGGMANPRASLHRPTLYEEVNVRGTLNLLELAGRYNVQDFVYASTSSVYGRAPTPWSEDIKTDQPLSPYAATKKAGELLAYTYHNHYGLPTRVVRFFTVYGPRGRPDMTPMLFVGPMLNQKPITLFNGGEGVYRDWTYVDDIVAGVVAALECDIPFDVFNLGNSHPVQLCDFVALLERITGHKAIIDAKPLSEAEPKITFANTEKAERLLDFQPRIELEEGLSHFWSWYKDEGLQTQD
ncbi:MAG: GDP-mannose 4,6-dehydratase [Chloroflexota bacterium]